MPTVKEIKTAIKSVLDATGQFGVVYTEDRTRIERSPAVVMWHDGGNQVPGAGRQMDRTTNITLGLLVNVPTGGEVDAQQTADTKLEALLDALAANPGLDSGAGPLVLSAVPVSWEVGNDGKNGRLVAEVTVAVNYLVG